LQHRPRLAGVANDQDLRAIRVGLQGRRPAPPAGEIRSEQLTAGSPDTIGPEQSSLRHLGRTLTLGELWPFPGLLEAGLAEVLDPGGAGQDSPALELWAQRRIHVTEGAGDAVADGRSLAGDAAAA